MILRFSVQAYSGGDSEDSVAGLTATAGIVSAVALEVALQSGDPARAVGVPADGTYTFNQAGVSGATLDNPARCATSRPRQRAT